MPLPFRYKRESKLTDFASNPGAATRVSNLPLGDISMPSLSVPNRRHDESAGSRGAATTMACSPVLNNYIWPTPGPLRRRQSSELLFGHLRSKSLAFLRAAGHGFPSRMHRSRNTLRSTTPPNTSRAYHTFSSRSNGIECNRIATWDPLPLQSRDHPSQAQGLHLHTASTLLTRATRAGRVGTLACHHHP